ncbi:hypothetical protein L596_021473 [Steinernema carpocapsae]|uniref:Uncharacterized protein n=1 Tax=Steinernema carpocapsae TaxID=34508 RepID=A0A4U5MIW4_STECR|nr:hypothetical protein L596_021473 [Steinernema carpocapsae]
MGVIDLFLLFSALVVSVCGNWSHFFLSAKEEARNLNSSLCLVRDVTGLCKSDKVWGMVATSAFNHVDLKKKQLPMLTSILNNDMAELISLSVSAPRQRNALLNSLQARQLTQLQEQIGTDTKTPLLVHVFLTRVVVSFFKTSSYVPDPKKINVNPSQYTDIYNALIKPDVRLMIRHYGRGLFDVSAINSLLLKRFEESLSLDTDTIKELRSIFKMVIQMVLDQKSTQCDFHNNRVPLMYVMVYDELELQTTTLPEIVYYPNEVFQAVVSLVNALEDMLCY